MRRTLFSWMIVMVALLWLAGCATTQGTGPERYEFEGPEALQGVERWLSGDEGAVPASLERIYSAEEAFLLGEARYWEGDLEGAYEAYVLMLQRFSGHGLNRYGVMRLYELRHDVIRFADRTREALDGVRLDEEGTLTRYGLVRLAHFVAYERWLDGGEAEPFAFVHGGAFDVFRATPRLSPWRLLDFERSFGPEGEAQLSEEYLSPAVATESPANHVRTGVVSITRPGERLELGAAGIYYLEAFLTVEGTRAREVTLGGQFAGATKVWVGDALVLERSEEDYQPGRYFRKVELGPGSHRVLVKVAHEPGSRDWFEFFVVPETGEVFEDQQMTASLEAERDAGRVRVRGEQYGTEYFEPVWPGGDEADDVGSGELYLGVISALASGDSEQFEALMGPLFARYPERFLLYLLASYEVRARESLPGEYREAGAMRFLRRAEELAPQNLVVMVDLEQALRGSGSDQELRALMDRARMTAMEVRAGEGGESEVGVRQIRPLVTWASYVERQGWSEDAEQAWRHVLGVDERNCLAATRLFGLYRQRNAQPSLEDLTPMPERCTTLVERYLDTHVDYLGEAVALAQREAKRFPYRGDKQRRYAEALRAVGELEAALDVVDEGLSRVPGAWELWEAKIELHLGMGDEEGAREAYREAARQNVRTAALDWRLSQLEGALPLVGLMYDGLELARQEVGRVGDAADLAEVSEEDGEADGAELAMDDSYYVLDYRGVEYFDDGASWVLTHQVIRTMTRGAIDQYAEISIPSNGRLLRARTIKESGEVRAPEEVPGKDTLSMPGLAEGDMVEIAYLQFYRPREIATHYEGPSFYFRRSGISSRHSELLVVNGEALDYEVRNGAPEAEEVEVDGKPALRFVARDVRHPRSEPRSVSSLEYLPWVRPYRDGLAMQTLDGERRYHSDALVGSARFSEVLRREAQAWLGREMGGPVSDEEVRRLFYEVAGLFTNPSPESFRFDATHAVQLRRGSPIVVLYSVLKELGVESDVYLARSDERPPERLEVSEISRFDGALLRVVMPESGAVRWLEMERMDAMFGAVEPKRVGQAAICVSCEEYREETVAADEGLEPRRQALLEGQIDESGTLTGRLEYTYEGVRAVRVRSALRGRRDGEERRQYLERILTAEMEGASLVDYAIEGEEARDEALVLRLEFARPGFARPVGDVLEVDRAIFEEALERIYATLSARDLPLMVGYERRQDYRLAIELPENVAGRMVEPRLRHRDVVLESEFGAYQRRAWLEGNTLHLVAGVELPRQRVMPEEYGAFRRWASEVEASAVVELQF